MRLIVGHNLYPRVWAVSRDERWMICRRRHPEGYVYICDYWKTDESRARYLIRAASIDDFQAQLAQIASVLFVDIQDQRKAA